MSDGGAKPSRPVGARPWPAELEIQREATGHSASTPAAPAQPPRPHAQELVLSSVWSMPNLEAAERGLESPEQGFVYRRDAHPNARSLAQKLARVHRASQCVLTAQGMSALAAVAWSVLRPNSQVWLARELYGKTLAMFTQGLGPWHVLSRTFDPNSAEDRERLAQAEPALVIVETISNPRLHVCPIAEIANITHAAGGLLMVDNTFASHLLTRPLELGADLCMESLTKIVSGHSDAMLGMVCGRDPSLMNRIAAAVSLYGLASSPLDCYLTDRGLATLPLRLEAACRNALALAEQLSQLPSISRVDYPGLPQHPQHALARQQLAAYGWMLTVELAGGRAAVATAIERLAPEIPFCPSLGDVQTTVSHPASTSHRALSADQQQHLGISQGTLRISCGAEPTDWLCQQFNIALG